MTIIETPRLALRQLTEEDAPFILELLNEPAFIEHIGDKGVRSLEDARGYIRSGPMSSYAAHGYGLYLVSLKGTHEPIGICGLVRRDGFDGPDIGYSIMARYWSQGYAYEAAAAVRDYSWDAFGLKRLLGVTSPSNDKSIKLLEKLGLRFERMVRLLGAANDSKLFVLEH